MKQLNIISFDDAFTSMDNMIKSPLTDYQKSELYKAVKNRQGLFCEEYNMYYHSDAKVNSKKDVLDYFKNDPKFRVEENSCGYVIWLN